MFATLEIFFGLLKKNFFFRVVHVTWSKLINEGESVKLLCQVDGFPLKTDTIKWRRDGYDIGELSCYYLTRITTNKNKERDLQFVNISKNVLGNWINSMHS